MLFNDYIVSEIVRLQPNKTIIFTEEIKDRNNRSVLDHNICFLLILTKALNDMKR